MSPDVIKKIMNMYGLDFTHVLGMEKGYRNESYPIVLKDGTVVNLMLFKREAGILTRVQNANYVADYLDSKGYPARRTYDQRILQLDTARNPRVAAIYTYLNGATIPWEAYTSAHIKALGKAMSDMHALLAPLERGTLPSVADEYQRILERMKAYFSDESTLEAMEHKLGVGFSEDIWRGFEKLLLAASSLSHQQALHMDFVRGNILFTEARISGVLDFEKTSFGHPLFDVARTLAFLLVDCKYKDEDKVRKYFLYSGYQKRGSARLKSVTLLSRGKKVSLLEALVNLFLVYDFYKFLRHNPYEFLHQNEHFIRTRDLILRRGLLEAGYNTPKVLE